MSVSNRTLQILMGFARTCKRRVSLDAPNEDIVKNVAYNMAVTDVVIFLERLLDNKISPEQIKALIKENE